MNEHDSERIAGLLEADGLAPADRRSTRPTSSCSTPAASGRTPTTSSTAHLGHLKSLKDAPPRPADRGRRLPGPEGPRPRPRAGAPRRRGVRHPQRRTAPPSCCDQARRRRARSPRSSTRPSATTTTPFPSALPARRDAGLRRRGSPSRSAATTAAPSASCPPVRGPEISRPFDDLVAEVEAPGRRRRHRGHPARPERQLLRPRPDAGRAGRGEPCRSGRCSPSCCGPSAPSTASAGSATPARTRRTCGPRRSRPWPRRRRCASTSTCRCRPGSDRVLAAMHRGYTGRALPRAAGRGPGRRRRPGRHHRPHRRLPGRDRRRLRAHPRGGGRGRLRQRLHLHLLAPARHRGGRAGPTSSSPAEVVAERFERLRVVVERSRPGPPPRPGSAGSRRSSSRARASKDPSVTTGRTRQNKLVHFAADRPLRPGTFADVRVTGAAPHHLRGRAGRGHRRARPPHPHPGGRRLIAELAEALGPLVAGAAWERVPTKSDASVWRLTGAVRAPVRYLKVAESRRGRRRDPGDRGAVLAARPPAGAGRGLGRYRRRSALAADRGAPGTRRPTPPSTASGASSALAEAFGAGLRAIHDLPTDGCPFPASLDELARPGRAPGGDRPGRCVRLRAPPPALLAGGAVRAAAADAAGRAAEPDLSPTGTTACPNVLLVPRRRHRQRRRRLGRGRRR